MKEISVLTLAESIPRKTKKIYEYKQISFAFEGKFNNNNYLFLQEQDRFQTKIYVNNIFLIFLKLFLILTYQNDLKTLKIY